MAGVSPLPEGWPTLSELQASTFGHLGQFAELCERIAGSAEDALEQLAQKVRAPGGVEWEGAAAEAAIAQADADVISARPFLWGLLDAAGIARRGQDTLEGGQRLALDAVDDAQRDGLEVNEDYRATDTRQASSREQLAERQAAAEAHSAFIRHRVGMLVANDQHLTAQLNEATADWGSLMFDEPAVPAPPERNGRVQAVDQHTFKDAPQPPPNPPPGGWSDDPITRAAQKITRGHAFDDHAAKDFPGMSREQLTKTVEDLLRRSGTDPSLITGSTPNNGIAVYDPKTNTLVIRDLRPNATQAGTVFKPEVPDIQKYLEGKIPVRTPLSPGNFADAPLPLPPPAPKVEPPPVARPPVEPPPAPPLPRAPAAPGPEPAPAPAEPLPKAPVDPRLPIFGAPGQTFGPHVVPPPHAHPHWLGETPEEEWEEGPASGH